MIKQQEAVCKSIIPRNNAITIEYRVIGNRQDETVTIPKGAKDYDFVATLKPGDKFIIEIHRTKLIPTGHFQFNGTYYPLPYIKDIEPNR